MSFGATITAGNDNQVIAPDLMKWLVEVRVEQDVNDLTRFAIRFEDNVCDGDFELADHPLLKTNTIISVIVPSGTTQKCLVRGPVTDVKTEKCIGVTGTWVEIHGGDRRVEMDREIIKGKQSGTAESIALTILENYNFKADTADASQQYDTTNQLIQRGSDLNFINTIAVENGLDFWISYDVVGSATLGTAYSVKETAHLKLSPPEGVTTAAAFKGIPVKRQAPSLRLNVDEQSCPNVNVFNCHISGERPGNAQGLIVDIVDTKAVSPQTNERPSKINPGRDHTELDNLKRYLDVVATGNPAELLRYQKAALREASWHINAEVSISAYQLETVLVPHDLIPVIGVGTQMSVTYQVKSVTHVINANQHLMDVKLRSNAGGQ